MPLLEDIPALEICDACNQLFTDFDTITGHLIRNEIWKSRNYKYRKVRSELEHSASAGCTFCSKVAFHDGHYRRGDANDNQITKAIHFPEPRPHWYPSPEEEVILEVEFDADRGALGFWPRKGVQLVDGPASNRISSLHWRLYATVGIEIIIGAILPNSV